MSLAGGGPQVNKFERVSGLGHQMSLARGPGLGLGDPCTGRVWAGTGARAWAPCIVRFKALWVMVPWEPPSHTRTTENITFPQLHWRVVMAYIFTKKDTKNQKHISVSQQRDQNSDTLTPTPRSQIITGRNEVVAKVIFLHLSVILFTGGGLPQCMLGYCPPRRPPWYMVNEQLVRILLECILV